MLNRLFAVWSLIFILLLAPITVLEMKTLGYEDYNFDTSGRDDDDYCEDTYEDDPNGCANDPLCESEYDDGEHECEEIEDDDEDDEE